MVGEWEERSPWAPLAERRGVPGDAVTVHGCTGTIDVADIVADNGVDLLELVGKSLAFPGHRTRSSARTTAPRSSSASPRRGPTSSPRAYPTIEDVQERLHGPRGAPRHRGGPRRTRCRRTRTAGSTTPASSTSSRHPDHMLVMVCGGLGNLHALALHSFGPTRAVTRPF